MVDLNINLEGIAECMAAEESAVPGFVGQVLELSADDRLTDEEHDALAAAHEVLRAVRKYTGV